MLACNHSSVDDCRNAHLRRYSLGASPISRLNTRLKELSDPYPTAEATSENDILFEEISGAPKVLMPNDPLTKVVSGPPPP